MKLKVIAIVSVILLTYSYFSVPSSRIDKLTGMGFVQIDNSFSETLSIVPRAFDTLDVMTSTLDTKHYDYGDITKGQTVKAVCKSNSGEPYTVTGTYSGYTRDGYHYLMLHIPFRGDKLFKIPENICSISKA